MITKFLDLLFFVVIVNCLFLSALHADDEYKVNIKQQFVNMTELQRNESTQTILNSYQQITHYLLEQLIRMNVPGQSTEGKEEIIYLLGEYRDRNSTNTLVEIINYKATYTDPKDKIARWFMYPAQEALVKIGMPAIKPIVLALPKETDNKRRELMVQTMIQVEGKDIAQFRLRKLQESVKDSKENANISIALKLPFFAEAE